MKILLMTNQLYCWAGSETVLVELAEEFYDRDFEVDVYVHNFSEKFVKTALPNANILSEIKDIEPCKYYMIYSQHQMLSLIADKILDSIHTVPFIVCGHLSPYEKKEFPGPVIEVALSSLSICNSPETLDKMVELGLDQEDMAIFPNPASGLFFEVPERKSSNNKSLLVVSNHIPKEVNSAINLIKRKGIGVSVFGIGAKRNERITPHHVQECDAVLTIGKTVQYALAARRPVYVYDRFGGPGWLSDSNIQEASKMNFSGRCCHIKKSAKSIFKEIVQQINSCEKLVSDHWRESYRLEKYVDDWLNKAQAHHEEQAQLQIDDDLKNMMKREQIMFKNLLDAEAGIEDYNDPSNIYYHAERSSLVHYAIKFSTITEIRKKRRIFKRKYKSWKKQFMKAS